MSAALKFILLLDLLFGAIFAHRLYSLHANPAPYRDLEIAFLYFADGGALLHPEVLSGANRAAATLGCSVRLIPTQRNAESLARDLKLAARAQPGALCVPGMHGAVTVDTFIREIEAAGIPVATYDEKAQLDPAKHRGNNAGFIGEDPYRNGWETANELVRRFKLPAGKTVLIAGGRTASGRTRAAGCSDALRALGLKADILSVRRRQSLPLRAQIQHRVEQLGGDVAGVVCVSAVLDAAVEAVEAMGKSATIPIAGFGINPRIEEQVRAGKVAFVSDSQWFVQGFFPVFQAVLSKRYGLSGLDCTLPARFLDIETLDRYRPPALKDLS
ncbi:MAG: substrate-binding domain-containing protein [Candidatus Hydrogenedentes bacterium]|nr:substrate-binding domain-containing protein [Candidatus Hydrogenedentota bacterium]